MTLRSWWHSSRIKVRRVALETRGAAPGALFLAGLVGALTIGEGLGPNTAAAIRYAGAVLQVLGLLLVAYGLDRTRVMFGRPTMTQRFREWLRRLVLAFRRPQNIVLHASTGEISMAGGTLTLGHGAVANATVEQRLDMLQRDLVDLRKQLSETRDALRQDVRAVRSQLGAEVRKRAESDARVENLLAELAVGGLHLEWIGLVWLVIATLCTAIPDELARLLS